MEKIKLRKFKMSDLDFLMRYFINEKIIENINLPKKAKDVKKKDETEYLKNSIKNYKSKKPEEYNLAILVNGEIMGVIGIHHTNYFNNCAELGYWIAEPYWGKGYATLATKEFLKEIFRKFGFIRINSFVNDYNIGSWKVLEKCGFKLECIRRKSVKKGNKYINDRQYSLIK